MPSKRDWLTREDAITVASVERGVAVIGDGARIGRALPSDDTERDPDDLTAWITDAAGGVLASFAKGLTTDHAAIAAA
jgi:hypothetical protein